MLPLSIELLNSENIRENTQFLLRSFRTFIKLLTLNYINILNSYW
jgi:hypothetical protein